jgi:hypothetical protein
MSYLIDECMDWLRSASTSDIVATIVGMFMTAAIIHLFIVTGAMFGTQT